MHKDWSKFLPKGIESGEAILFADWRGKIEWANSGFLRLTGYELDDVINRKPGALLQGHETDRRVVDAMRDAINLGLDIGVTVRNYTKEGKPYDVALAISPLTDQHGAIQHYVGVARVVTEATGIGVQAVHARILIRLAELVSLYQSCSPPEVISFSADESFLAPLADFPRLAAPA